MLSLFDAATYCAHGCGKKLDGEVRWEVRVTATGYPLPGPDPAEVPVATVTQIVCAGCAHHYPNKRQLP